MRAFTVTSPDVALVDVTSTADVESVATYRGWIVRPVVVRVTAPYPSYSTSHPSTVSPSLQVDPESAARSADAHFDAINLYPASDRWIGSE